MEELIKLIRTDLPSWAYVVIIFAIIIGIVLIAKITGNNNKKSISISKISQKGQKNTQQIAETINNKVDK